MYMTQRAAWLKVAWQRSFGLCYRLRILRGRHRISAKTYRLMVQKVYKLMEAPGALQASTAQGGYVWARDAEGHRKRRDWALERARRCRS